MGPFAAWCEMVLPQPRAYPKGIGLLQMSISEQAAVRAFQRRLQQVGGRLDELKPVSPYAGGMMPGEEKPGPSAA
jgi:hypothetical protein